MHRLLALLLACLSWPAFAQPHEGWTFDPDDLLARSDAVIERTPDDVLDHLFQAVVESARRPPELQAMCAVFEPDAARDLRALNRIALGFPQASQRRFQRATERVLSAAERAPPQPYDDALARRALRQAGVQTAMLYDGFVAAVNSIERQDADSATRQARCRALRQLLDTVSMRPLRERAMITRLLMREGLRQIDR